MTPRRGAGEARRALRDRGRRRGHRGAARASASARCASSTTCASPTSARSSPPFRRGNDGTPQPIDEHPFAIGSRLEIKLGAREELTTTTLFRGDVVSLDLDFGPGSIELLVRGLDRSHVLQRSRRCRTFQNQTSSDIVEKILGEASFDVRDRPERRSARVHPAGQRDRLGLHLAAGRADRLRAGDRGRHGSLPPPGSRPETHGGAGVADHPSLRSGRASPRSSR